MPQRPSIVILGGGFGGAYCAQSLEKEFHREQAEITLLDRNNYFVFYPLLVEAGTGSLEPRHAVVSIRAFLRHTTFRMAEVLDVDFRRREVLYRVTGIEPDTRMSYDHLVVALGSATRLPDIPGLKMYGQEMKTPSDAVALRDRAIHMLEAADANPDPEKRRALLHFVVVGGNFTGAEVAGEFHVFLRSATRLYPNLSPEECNVTLVELTDRILSALDPDLSDYALEQLRRRGIYVLLNSSVTRIEESQVHLKDGQVLPAATVIWCAGIQPSRLVQKLDLPVDRLGYILCERDLSVKGLDNVWAIGDCAVNPDPAGKPYPATAQHASRQARHLAKNLSRVLKGQPPLPCDIESQGALAALGCRTGVARIFGLKLSGLPAWFLWRTVYLLKMPGLRRKIRVALDWTTGLLFARDYVQLGVHRPPRQAERKPEEKPAAETPATPPPEKLKSR
jgi:NADH:ubiquinone reductase (H+-translocating)